LVVACNTATALALDKITAGSGVPVVGVIDPGAESASKASANQKVVVVGTDATISSHAYLRALEARGIRAKEKACPLLVPLVEEGWVEHAVTEQVARIYLDEAFAENFENADVLLLGCTHYPLIAPLLRRVVPSHVKIVDSAESTAHVVKALPQGAAILVGAEEERRKSPRLKFFATDSVDKFRRLGARFLGREIQDVEHVDLKE
jgi:glutamate racemase